MKITRKILLTLLSVWLVIIGWTIASSVLFILQDYKQLDQQKMEQLLKQSKTIFRDQIESVLTMTRDWAHWDATYAFVQDKNTNYLKENINDTTFTDANINVILYFNSNKQLVFGAYYDIETKKVITQIPPSLLSAIENNKSLFVTNPIDYSIGGFIRADDHFVITSSAAITTSKITGPSRGVLVIAKIFTPKNVASIAEKSNLPIQLLSLNTESLTSPSQKAIEELKRHSNFVFNEDKNTMLGFTFLTNIDNKPIAMIKITQPRSIYKRGKTTIWLFIGIMLLGGLIVAGILWLALNKVVLNRILNLSTQVSLISQKELFGKATNVTGNDEVSKIATAVNKLISVIRKHEKSLNERLKGMTNINKQLKDEIQHRIMVEQQLTSKQNELDHVAHHDPLTDLPNRTLFNQLLLNAMAKCKRENKQLAVLFIDLDGFKDLNDTMGHKVGDLYLKQLGKNLKGDIRESDVLARIGGDEFMLFTAEADRDFQPETLAQKILSIIRKPVDLLGTSIELTGSIGISIYPDDARSANDLQRTADLAMYEAKRQGKNNFVLYDSSIGEVSSNRLEIETGLRASFVNEDFKVHMQPIYDIESNKIVMLEALARWIHPEKGLLYPMVFIPIAEQSSLIYTLTECVLEETCRNIQKLSIQGIEIERVAVNISARCLSVDEFPSDIMHIIEKHQIKPDQIMLEITETSLIENVNETISKLQSLKQLGFCIAIDDFGTGYSSLLMLKYLPIDFLKIDRQFTAALGSDKESDLFTKNIIRLAHDLGLEVIAEGVEAEQQLTKLAELNADYAQGFYFSRAVPLEKVIELITTHTLD